MQSAIKLYGFQRRWLADKSRFKIANICRQAGKSFMLALEACLEAVETGSSQVLLSAGERQSKELMAKCKLHLEAMKIAASDIAEDFFADTRCRQLSIDLPNGARIIGLPANPDTARGFTADVYLDEFAFHKDSDRIWQALFPTISRGYKLRISSTPQGRSNRFYHLFTGDNNFSRHLVDIHRAVADGVPHNIDELKSGIDDEDAWQQEYLCQFVDEATAFLTYDLIAGCEDPTLSAETDILPTEAPQLAGRCYGGVDIGRKKDLTVIWVIEQLGDVYWTRLLLSLRRTKFSIQRQIIADAIRRYRLTRQCIDSTGLGAQLAEETADTFGPYRAESVDFTLAVKNDLATRTRRMFEDRRLRIPTSGTIRNDLHSVKKTVTAAGNIRFDAERTAEGHADRFWALALALMATDQAVQLKAIVL